MGKGFYKDMQIASLIGFVLTIAAMVMMFIPGMQVFAIIFGVVGVLMMGPSQTWMQWQKFNK